jgi:glycosyltransferase involved in cell wall biosynthesis
MLKTIMLYYPSFENGGATKNLINITNFFIKKKINVLLFSYKADKKKFIKNKYLTIINTKPITFFSFLPIRWNLALSSVFNLNSYIKRNKKNSIIFSMQSHIPAIIVAKLNNIKISIRNSEEPLGATFYADNRILSFFVLLLKIFFYNFSDQIIAISRKSEKSLNRIVLSKKKISLVYNPYLDKILKVKNKKKNKSFTILSSGRLTKQKNFFLLINSVINLSKKYKFINLTIVGSGNQYDIIKTKTLPYKNIKIVGWKPNLKKFFSKSDLFVLSSYYEGLPNTLIEAVNYEVPCIATNVSGVKDILLNGKGGMIVPNNNQQKLQNKIEYAINNRSKLKIMSLMAKKQVFRFTKINLLLMDKLFNDLKKV